MTANDVLLPAADFFSSVAVVGRILLLRCSALCSMNAFLILFLFHKITTTRNGRKQLLWHQRFFFVDLIAKKRQRVRMDGMVGLMDAFMGGCTGGWMNGVDVWVRGDVVPIYLRYLVQILWTYCFCQLWTEINWLGAPCMMTLLVFCELCCYIIDKSSVLN